MRRSNTLAGAGLYLMVTATLLVGCSMSPVLNIESAPVLATLEGAPPELSKVEAAVLSACQAKGWTARVVSPGRVAAAISVRGKHSAEVEIPFSSTQYSIVYKSSNGLKYDDGDIHRNYNRWIAGLDAAIQMELSKLR